jgi:hypothetical protein
MQDPELRQEVVTTVGQEWARRDRGAALAWLARSDLPPAQREAILAPPRSR